MNKIISTTINQSKAMRRYRLAWNLTTVLAAASLMGCTYDPQTAASSVPGPSEQAAGPVNEVGDFEVTARLVEIPEGAIIRRELYDYAAVLKYEVLEVHRGQIDDQIIYVGQYNPLKSRRDAADMRVPDIGGSLKTFQVGRIQRMALVAPIDEVFLGGIVNKYFDEEVDPIYFALWTDQVDP